jgi:hypothetical protein
MTRKEDKLRPYRVDFFEIEEMKDNDLALVRSVIVRAVTAAQAENLVLWEERHGGRGGRIIIRAYRYYKSLVHRKDVYKAVEDLFTANKAIKVMEQVEAYRAMSSLKTVLGPASSNAQVPYDKPIWTEPVEELLETFGAPSFATPETAAFDNSGVPIPQKFIVIETGPDSPATKAVIADMQGMISHDAHEQAMDTFVPDSVPEGKRFPDPANAPITTFDESLIKPSQAAEPAAEQPLAKGFSPEAVRDGWEQYKRGEPQAVAPWTDLLGEPLIEPGQAVGCSARPPFNGPASDVSQYARIATGGADSEPPPAPERVGEAFGGSTLTNALIFGGVLLVVFGIVYCFLHR